MLGNNYESLYSIKQKHDPTGLFWYMPEVGSDDYVLDNHRLCMKATNAMGDTRGLLPVTDYNNLMRPVVSITRRSPSLKNKRTRKLRSWDIGARNDILFVSTKPNQLSSLHVNDAQLQVRVRR